MADNLRKKTFYSLLWSGFDKVGVQLVAFLVGVVTARLLSPHDFGLMGALTIFTILSNTLVESGFTAALVRRKTNTNSEYVATFYFNILLSLIVYGVLFVSAPFIADYFRMPELCKLARFLFLAIIINSLGLVQNVILTKELSFKLLTKVNLVAVVVSGICAVLLIVVFEMSYWALAYQQIIMVSLKSLLLWWGSKWRIDCRPDFSVIKELFSFSIFLLLTSVITNLVRHIYNIIIGRFYTIQDLGYYAQAYKYQQIPSAVISATLTSVAYPVLAKLNDDTNRQLIYFRKLVRLTALFTFPIMIGLIAVAENFVEVILSEKWMPIVSYFKILLLVGIFYPFHTLVLNILTAKGFPKWNFALEMIRNGLVVCLLLIWHDSIMQMLYGLLVATVLSTVVDMILVAQKTAYRIFSQMWDVLPYFVVSILMFVVVKLLAMIHINLHCLFIVQVVGAVVFYFSVLKFGGSKLLNDSLDLLKNQKRTL
ncbi:MAG: lipopolysaccharide biosynthesis protein [Paludibacteraceae bacterium]|nr:lipopolysaccharide biosynthesis protein [Paludibacteraceae bacterium]